MSNSIITHLEREKSDSSWQISGSKIEKTVHLGYLQILWYDLHSSAIIIIINNMFEFTVINISFFLLLNNSPYEYGSWIFSAEIFKTPV
jgi:hypothetical protein